LAGIQQKIGHAECICTSGQLFFLWLVELEIPCVVDSEYFVGLWVWIFRCVTKPQKSQAFFVAQYSE
jgi:hypothetical protein